jgi:hypothetical protein
MWMRGNLRIPYARPRFIGRREEGGGRREEVGGRRFRK